MTGANSFDFIVVGSGAGGGVLAARLARNDKNLKVLLIEAGGDPRYNTHYRVPAFHALATEDADLRWDYFVKHFTDPVREREDEKYHAGKGIFYPRASALGGCTAHHALITVYPDPSDWNDIAKLTRDESWRHEQMWHYFERCTRRKGFAWLPMDAAGPSTLLSGLRDPSLRAIIRAAVQNARKNTPHFIHGVVRSLIAAASDFINAAPDSIFGDTNHEGRILRDREGLYRIPVSTREGARCGVTEFLIDTKYHRDYGDNLTIWTDRLVTRVLLEGGRAVGVEYLPMARAYRADRRDSPGDQRGWSEVEGDLKRVAATREVILAGGAFNTPQLLMLSGIGPEEELARHGIEPVIPRAGVGTNLQDRYEVAVIDELPDEFSVLQGCTFDASSDDAGYRRWVGDRDGLYTTNGGTIAIIKRSSQQAKRSAGKRDCDLFIFGIPGEFGGYRLNYSERVRTREGRSRFSWVILKAHTENVGRLTLRSDDPRDPPEINFQNFKDGKDASDPDLLAVAEAVDFIRGIMGPLRQNGKTREVIPGPEIRDAALHHFIMTRAWGHHASCTCRIGPDDDDRAVVDKDFRVIGVRDRNLRIVDASVFPKIPGYFIVLPIYLIAEKAADVILKTHGAVTMPG